MTNETTALELPEPAFRLIWCYGAYYVSEPDIGDTDCYTADQLHACAEMARAPLVEENARLLARVAGLGSEVGRLSMGATRHRQTEAAWVAVREENSRLRAEVEKLREVLIRARRGLAWASRRRPALIEDYEAVDAAIAARNGPNNKEPTSE